MSSAVQALRAAQRVKIAENPMQITITRTVKQRQGGGFAQVPSTVGPLTVRIYMSGQRQTAPVETLAGDQQREPWGLLADHQADLQAGPHVTDEFTTPGGEQFRIKTVRAYKSGGQLIGYQAQLEKVT